MSEEFDFLGLLRALTKHRVRFVIIGGIAAAALGSPQVTYDLDICYDRSRDNLEKLATALQELKATLRGAPPDVPFLLDAGTIERGDHFTFTTPAGSIDILGTPAGSKGFEELVANASEVDFEDATALVASIDDLIRMKLAAGRPKDRITVENLGALRDELEENS